MALEHLAEKLPEYAADLKLNLSSLLNQTELSQEQLWGTLVACACAGNNPFVANLITKEASSYLTPESLRGAKAAAAVMGMNNVYYRFTHQCSNEKYRSIPARLRMNIMRSHGVDQSLFELWSLAVSAINGCFMCVDAHEKVVRERGVSEEQVLTAVRIASVLKGVSAVLTAEGVYDPVKDSRFLTTGDTG